MRPLTLSATASLLLSVLPGCSGSPPAPVFSPPPQSTTPAEPSLPDPPPRPNPPAVEPAPVLPAKVVPNPLHGQLTAELKERNSRLEALERAYAAPPAAPQNPKLGPLTNTGVYSPSGMVPVYRDLTRRAAIYWLTPETKVDLLLPDGKCLVRTGPHTGSSGYIRPANFLREGTDWAEDYRRRERAYLQSAAEYDQARRLEQATLEGARAGRDRVAAQLAATPATLPNPPAAPTPAPARAPAPAPGGYNRGGLTVVSASLRGCSNQRGGYITGTLRNDGPRRTYVQVVFRLYDAEDRQVGSAVANTLDLEAGGEWVFKAAALTPFDSYKVSSITYR